MESMGQFRRKPLLTKETFAKTYLDDPQDLKDWTNTLWNNETKV